MIEIDIDLAALGRDFLSDGSKCEAAGDYLGAISNYRYASQCGYETEDSIEAIVPRARSQESREYKDSKGEFIIGIAAVYSNCCEEMSHVANSGKFSVVRDGHGIPEDAIYCGRKTYNCPFCGSRIKWVI